MTQYAVVKRLVADQAEIEVHRASACGHNCEECGGGCSELTRSGPVTVLALNPVGARPGDRVVVESSTKRILGFAALVYLMPLALFFAGYLAARALRAAEGAALCAGGVCFLLSIALAVLADRRAKARSRELFSIVSICGP